MMMEGKQFMSSFLGLSDFSLPHTSHTPERKFHLPPAFPSYVFLPFISIDSIYS